MSSTSKIEGVSQKSFVFDVVNLSFADLLRFLKLSSKNIEEVSSNSFIFKLADRQIDRQAHLPVQLPLHYTTTTAQNTTL